MTRAKHIAPVALLLALAVTVPAVAETFLSLEEAPKAVFPEATEILRRDVKSGDNFQAKLRELIGRAKPTIWEPFYITFTASRNGELLGYAVVCEEIGKHRPITFITAVNPAGEIIDVAVMMYREAYGGEVRYPAFTKQFRGKSLEDPLAPRRDLKIIGGATLSSRSMARGVRKALAVLRLVYLDGESVGDDARANARVAEPAAIRQVRVKRARYIMGTIFEITALGPERGAPEQAVEEAFAVIRRADQVMSHYRPASDLMRLNRNGFKRDVPVPAELFDVLTESLRYTEVSGGAFDVTVAPLVRLWERSAAQGRVPNGKEIAVARAGSGTGAIELTPAHDAGGEARARLLRKGSEINLGAIGKGWAVDRAVDVLRGRGIRDALVSAGTSTLYAMGSSNGQGAQSGWRVDLVDPCRLESFATYESIWLRDASLSTSASYEQFWEIGGVRYSHIIDPRTGYPVEPLRSVSVIGRTAAETDAISTAVYVLGLEEGRRLLGEMGLGGYLVAPDSAPDMAANSSGGCVVHEVPGVSSLAANSSAKRKANHGE